jgi:hypothetical protein
VNTHTKILQQLYVFDVFVVRICGHVTIREVDYEVRMFVCLCVPDTDTFAYRRNP